MNQLSLPQQAQVVALLTEGTAIRATERLLDIHRDTIMRIGERIGALFPGDTPHRPFTRLLRNPRERQPEHGVHVHPHIVMRDEGRPNPRVQLRWWFSGPAGDESPTLHGQPATVSSLVADRHMQVTRQTAHNRVIQAPRRRVGQKLLRDRAPLSLQFRQPIPHPPHERHVPQHERPRAPEPNVSPMSRSPYRPSVCSVVCSPEVIARSCAREAGKSVRSGRKQRYRNSPCAVGSPSYCHLTPQRNTPTPNHRPCYELSRSCPEVATSDV